MREITLTETDRRTLACALSIMIDIIKAQEINENVTMGTKTVALLSCAKLIDAFDLEEYTEELENVL